MDKSILKKFAIESRQDLMKKIEGKLKTFYIDEEFSKEQKNDIYVLTNDKHSLKLTNEQFQKRELLIKRIKELSLEQVIEEASYTWFNRIIALRYMELNDMLPLTKTNSSLGIRVLSSKDNTPDPEIMKFSNLANPELDIDFKKEHYAKLEEQDRYEYVLLLVCKKLGKVIPQVFDGVTDYIDILIPDNLLKETGFINKIVTEVPENNFVEVEVIGWLYQYYNQLEKDRVMSEKKGYNKNEIPFATQLFTPDWIVKYMVENSLGRYWLEHSSVIEMKREWKYYIDSELEKKETIHPTDITFIDPCSGSGHILVYAFEVFYQIYLSAGYSKSVIPELILKNNLYGLDIDDRAGQLSLLSVVLKAREYDKNIFNKNIITNLNIVSIQESSNIQDFSLDSLSEANKTNAKYLKEIFSNAKEIGSLLLIEDKDYSSLLDYINSKLTLETLNLRESVIPLVKQAEMLSKKYDIVVTNPPYMTYPNMTDNIKQYLNKNYRDSKKDLCTAFMELRLHKKDGLYAMINQHSWMFLNSYGKLREKFIKDKNLLSMVHLGTRAFEEIGGEVVQTTAFVFSNKESDISTIYFRLVQYNDSRLKEENYKKMLKEKSYFEIDNKMFLDIPGYTFDYWVSANIIKLFKNKKIKDNAQVITGMTTGDNNKFLKLWFEVENNKISFSTSDYKEIDILDKYYFPYSKGGERVKWYGGYDYVVNWSLSNLFNRSKTTLKHLYFKKALTWPFISSGNLTVKMLENGYLWDVAGSPCFVNDDKYFNYILSFLNTPIASNLLDMVNPTINIQAADIEILPIIFNDDKLELINALVENNIEIAKQNWSSFETSWDFKTLPLVYWSNYIKETHSEEDLTISISFNSFLTQTIRQFEQLKQNEEELNKIFIDIYGLKDELTPEVLDKDVTVNKADRVREVKSLISYAVGCMFGRYSLDEDGLIYAGGNFDESKYKTFKVDKDNVIPITEDSYFSDDIVSRFKNFIEVVWGKDTLNENLNFVAEALGKRGTETSEDTIRRYFNNDFYNDHVKMYQKKPIYWLFESGNKNGFKCLVYMHRYNDGLVAKVRLDYLHRMQTTYERLLTDINSKLSNEDLDMSSKKEAQKQQVDINAKLQETIEYDEKIAHIANQRINIDLDDGVTVNYSKFVYKNPKTGKEESILGKLR